MRIELRKLKIVKALSEETPCYTAEIWIDGAIAFLASNRGHGGADEYRQVGALTEAEVNAWLKINRPSRSYDGLTLEPDLEHEVARLIDEAEQLALLRRRLRSNIITIEGGAVYTYALKGRPAAAVIAAVRARKPDIGVVNEMGEPGLARAVQILLAQADAADAERPDGAD
ncbi:hypothetical protein BV96_03832 [Sphingomonas paucimobilis]|jgi:hypothetical protein|uniref:hypothetical protein n=1 Tax=Sphingobium sp. DC-2 TaxID=1303256 RepID=UPI00044FE530|nr:hypothetical protein [Sphingobium sp. DC-2]EZP69784.1 hypothetical protein BV96_03832 [Sphingomonas paucimobilis]